MYEKGWNDKKRKFKGMKIIHNLIKIPTYILSLVCFVLSMTSSDLKGMVISLVTVSLVATFGNELKLLSNFKLFI